MLYFLFDVFMMFVNVFCNVMIQIKNKNLFDFYKSYLFFDFIDVVYLDFGVNLYDLIIVYLDLENVLDVDLFEIYVKGGILLIKINFDVSFKVWKNQKNYRIFVEKFLYVRGFLMIVVKGILL